MKLKLNLEEINIAITARLTWDKSKQYSTEFGYKGTDIFLKGFAQFVSRNSNLNVKLHLFKKGEDIQETKDVIQKLNIEKYFFGIMN